MTGETETVERVGWSLFCGQGSAVRAAHLDPTNPAFWLSRLRFSAVSAVLFRLSVLPHAALPSTPLHGTPPPPPKARSMRYFLDSALFLARLTQNLDLGMFKEAACG